MSSTTTLVPPRRLGTLLRQARLAAGLELEDLAPRSQLSVVELDDVEHGRRALDEAVLTGLLEMYGVERWGLIPERSQLVIDLDEGRISVHRSDVDLGMVSGPDAVLARYLALVYRLRELRVGTAISLRDIDLGVLATALEIESTDVERRLHRLIGSESTVEQDQRRIRRQLLVPLIGVVIAATSVGTLVLVAENDTAPSPGTVATTIDPSAASVATPAIAEVKAIVTDLGNGAAVEENPVG